MNLIEKESGPRTMSPPLGWRVVKLKYVMRESRVTVGDVEADLEMLSVSQYTGVGLKTFEDSNKTKNREDVRTYLVVEPDSLVLNSMWLNHRGLGVSRFRGYVSPAYRVWNICPAEPLRPQFLHYLMRSDPYVSEYRRLSYGIRPNSLQMSRDDFASLPLVFPTLREQDRIAGFLDEKTAAIDAAIAKKQRLLALLEEKRAAVINQAVTKGLDPTVPMKDSGIPWIGQIPEHWEIKRLKFVLDGIEQGWSPQCYNYPAEPGQWAVMRTGCVNRYGFDAGDNKRLPDELEPRHEYEIRPGDFLMSRANTSSLVGSAALVGDIPSCLILSDKLYRIRFDRRRLSGEFLELFMGGSFVRNVFARDSSGASGSMQNLSQDSVGELPILLPPRTEQIGISHELGKLVSREKYALEVARRVITKLREYRQALITAAVTGQLTT